jgi:hypothetical protein
MLETVLFLGTSNQCNFCRKIAFNKVTFYTTNNSSINVNYCKDHYTELKRAFIDQVLLEKEEEVFKIEK